MTAKKTRIKAKALTVGLMAGALTLVGYAGNGTWTNAMSGGLWSGPENWSDAAVADGDGYTADFSAFDKVSAKVRGVCIRCLNEEQTKGGIR